MHQSVSIVTVLLSGMVKVCQAHGPSVTMTKITFGSDARVSVAGVLQEPENIFDIPCDLAFPCSHRNEIDGELIQLLEWNTLVFCS